MTSTPERRHQGETLRGPWCEPTDEVHMPPDVMPYAIGTEPIRTISADMKVKFQVIRFRPDGRRDSDEELPGRTRAKSSASPAPREIPSSDGTKRKTSTIDFNSHQIVLDIIANKKTGGIRTYPAGFVGPPIERPAITLLLRTDGSVAAAYRGRRRGERGPQGHRRQLQTGDQGIRSGKKRERSTGMGMGAE